MLVTLSPCYRRNIAIAVVHFLFSHVDPVVVMSVIRGAEAFDVLTATATQLQHALDTNVLTSVKIVKTYLAQIERHNVAGAKLHALISVAPTAHLLAEAQRLDDERQLGRVRGPLHSLPIVVKVSCKHVQD